jgi:hypothetical protein
LFCAEKTVVAGISTNLKYGAKNKTNKYRENGRTKMNGGVDYYS